MPIAICAPPTRTHYAMFGDSRSFQTLFGCNVNSVFDRRVAVSAIERTVANGVGMRASKPYALFAVCLILFCGMSSGQESPTLEPGQGVDEYASRIASQPFVIQRVSEHVYWVAVDTFNSTVVVGSEGVMVIDPMAEGRSTRLIEAVGQITELPITALVYSHSHMDHIGDASDFVVEASGGTGELRILATDKTVQQISYYSKPVPLPTEIVSTPEGAFEFDDTVWIVYTPVESGHSTDSSIFFNSTERFVHAADLVEPGNLPFLNFNNSVSVRAFEDAVEHLLEFDWDFLNGGHGDVGGRADAEFYLEYIDDFEAAALSAMQSVDFGQFVVPDAHPTAALIAWSEAIAEEVTAALSEEYGDYTDLQPKMLGHVQSLIRDGVLHGAGAFD